jgi:RNA polymerase sigma factor (sigma-70 family)
MQVMSESDLIGKCIAQKREAQRILYERYKKAMYSICLRILADSHAAQNALQEAFLEIFRDIIQFRGDVTLGSWIKRIVFRKAIARIRKDSRYLPYSAAVAEPQAPSMEFVNTHLERALVKLPPGARAVLMTVSIHGYTHKETAVLLGISEGTSKSQLYQAKKLL